MEENWLRWKGRIGAFKPIAVLILIGAAFAAFYLAGNILPTFNNLSGPQTVTLQQLVTGQVGADHYIAVTGMAAYRLGYHETNDGAVVAIFYPLIDNSSGHLIFVRTTDTAKRNAADETVTVSGLTHSVSSDLQTLITQDTPDITAAGFTVTKEIYLDQGHQPMDWFVLLLAIGVTGLVAVLCIATFFFPTVMFAPYPVQPVTQSDNINKSIRASGEFQQLTKLDPFVFGKSRQKFQNAVANLFITESNSIGVYIHYIHTTRVYGVQVRKQETHWAVMLNPSRVTVVQPGKVYAWKESWAISLHYKGADSKDKTVIIAFASQSAQAGFVQALRTSGYRVSSGQFDVTTS